MASAEKSLLGSETVQTMRKKGNQAIVCGLSANDIRDTFTAAGADDFLLKPLPTKKEQLQKVLERLLEHRQVTLTV